MMINVVKIMLFLLLAVIFCYVIPKTSQQGAMHLIFMESIETVKKRKKIKKINGSQNLK